MILLLPGLALAADLLLTGGRVWDGTGSAPFAADVLVQDDRIVAIGLDLAVPEGATVLDASGATVMPGLIDAHVHLSMDPGAAWRSDDAETHQALLEHHLRAFLACGVTTILDPAILPDELVRVRDTLAGGAPGPRYLTLGTPFSPPDGYVANVIEGFPSVATTADVERQLDLVASQDVVGIKVTVERGMLFDRWPLFSPELLTGIRTGAAARGLPIYVHAYDSEAQRIAIDDLGAYATVHPLDRPDAEAVAAAKRAGLYEMSTIMPAEAFRTPWMPERLEDPWLARYVPAAELASARDPAVVRSFERAAMTTLAPRMPFKDRAARSWFARRIAEKKTQQADAALRALRDAGVPIVMGSDSGNWPIIPFLFHGTSSIQELEMLVQAGFTPTEALLTATRNATQMLRMEAEIGAVAEGRRADLIVVEGDPTLDLSTLRTLRWVIRDGTARSPEQWMAAP